MIARIRVCFSRRPCGWLWGNARSATRPFRSICDLIGSASRSDGSITCCCFGRHLMQVVHRHNPDIYRLGSTKGFASAHPHLKVPQQLLLRWGPVDKRSEYRQPRGLTNRGTIKMRVQTSHPRCIRRFGRRVRRHCGIRRWLSTAGRLCGSANFGLDWLLRWRQCWWGLE